MGWYAARRAKSYPKRHNSAKLTGTESIRNRKQQYPQLAQKLTVFKGVKSALIWPRKLAVSLIAAGAALVCGSVLPMAYGRAMSHLTVAAFRAQGPVHRLWDSARIRAYHETLHVHFAPPEAILRVPRIGIEAPVLEGVSDAVLNRGVGHIAGTALPGEPGNLAITGHRDGFFRPLKDIATGDIVEVERTTTSPGSGDIVHHTDRYAVRSTRIVFPSDISVLNATSDSTLTLITCYPFYYVGAAPRRFVVEATLLPPSSLSSRAAASTAQTIPGE